MPRPPKWISTLLATLSLLLFLSTCALWIRAQFIHDWVQWLSELPNPDSDPNGMRPAISYVLITSSHSIDFEHFECELKPEEDAGFQFLPSTPDDDSWNLALGPGFYGSDGGPHSFWVSIDFWIFCLVFALYPAFKLFRHIFRRTPPGCCRKCGYDLRATPHQCPECGTLIQAPAPSNP